MGRIPATDDQRPQTNRLTGTGVVPVNMMMRDIDIGDGGYMRISRKALAVVALIAVGLCVTLIVNRSEYIFTSGLYRLSYSRAEEPVAFTVNTVDYASLKPGKHSVRQLLMSKHDSEVWLDSVIVRDNYIWFDLSLESRWPLLKGTCLTSRFFDGNVYSSGFTALPFQVTDQDGNEVNFGWGGGGSTNRYGFEIPLSDFAAMKTLNASLTGYNVVRYQLNWSTFLPLVPKG